MKQYILSLVFALTVLSSCTYYNEEELFPNEICDTSNITYSVDIVPIFDQNCYSCHSSSTMPTYRGNLNLEIFDHVLREVNDGKLLQYIKHEPGSIPMPYGGTKLSDCNINKIEKWINLGSPNN